jgi:hypothetical protein
VIAAIYGLTLTGFIFFRNELSREELEDETLVEAVEALKARYFALLVFITGLVGLTLLLSNLAISFESSAVPGVNAVIINSGQSAFLTSLAAIAYFIFDVISPRRVARASRALQNRLDPSAQRATKGSLETFVRNYNEIEQLLTNAAPLAQDSESRGREGRVRRHVPNARLAEVLFRNERIDKSLFDRLRNLISLRNSIIHGADPVVSDGIVKASKEALRDLQTALGAWPAEGQQ